MQSEQPKVFAIGFHKTGTTSLWMALQALGYHAIHGDPRRAPHNGTEGRDLLEQYIRKGNYRLPTFDRYDAFSDNPYFTIWREILTLYPDAKYILTKRDEQKWIASCERYYKNRRIRPMRAWMFGAAHADPSKNEESRQVWLDTYRTHNQDIIDHFASIGKELLVMDVTAGDGWEVLCPFLEKEIPETPFPHKKKSTGKKKKGIVKRIHNYFSR